MLHNGTGSGVRIGRRRRQIGGQAISPCMEKRSYRPHVVALASATWLGGGSQGIWRGTLRPNRASPHSPTLVRASMTEQVCRIARVSYPSYGCTVWPTVLAARVSGLGARQRSTSDDPCSARVPAPTVLWGSLHQSSLVGLFGRPRRLRPKEAQARWTSSRQPGEDSGTRNVATQCRLTRF